MGFRVLLVAVTGKEPAVVHDEYAVSATNQYEGISESPVTGMTLPNGNYLLYVNDEILPDELVFVRLSQNASLMACYANETCGVSVVGAWENGLKKWAVMHDPERGLTHLETSGDLPHQLEPIRQRLLAEQAASQDVDYVFDIPIELFKALGGIRYDTDIEGVGPKPWQVLARIKGRRHGSKKSWPFNFD